MINILRRLKIGKMFIFYFEECAFRVPTNFKVAFSRTMVHILIEHEKSEKSKR